MLNKNHSSKTRSLSLPLDIQNIGDKDESKKSIPNQAMPDTLHLTFSALQNGIGNIERKYPNFKDRIIHINTPIKYDYPREVKPSTQPPLDFNIVQNRITTEIPQVIDVIEKALQSEEKTIVIWSKSPKGRDEQKERESVKNGLRNYIAHTDFILVDKGKIYLPLCFTFLQDTKILHDTLTEKFPHNYFSGEEVTIENMKNTMPQKDTISCGAYALIFAEKLLCNSEEISINKKDNVILPENCRDYFQRNTEAYGGSSCKNAKEVDKIRQELSEEKILPSSPIIAR